MIKKIKEALRQEYKSRLELHDEQLEGVAAFASTFAGVTDESKVEEFVKNEATFKMLKSFQKMLDKDRAKRKVEGDQGQQDSDNGNETDPKSEPPKQGLSEEDIVRIVTQTVTAANKPLMDEFAGFKAEQSAKTALATAESAFKSNDYVKKYADEAAEAWERAADLYELDKKHGTLWSAEELQTKAMGYFTKSVAKRGIDTAKPFKGDGGAGDAEPDFSSFDRAAKDMGWDVPESK